MSKDKTLANQKKRKLPHIYGLLFIIIVVCTIATWILPAGEFDRADVGGRSVAVAGTYHAVEASPVNPFQMFQAIYNGFGDAGGVIFFVFISYAAISIIIGSGAFNGLVAALLRVFKGKARVIIIPVFLTIIGVASSTIGLFEEWFPFIPVFAGIAVAMGFGELESGREGPPDPLPRLHDRGGLLLYYPVRAEGSGRPHQEPGLRRRDRRDHERGGGKERPLLHSRGAGPADPGSRDCCHCIRL